MYEMKNLKVDAKMLSELLSELVTEYTPKGAKEDETKTQKESKETSLLYPLTDISYDEKSKLLFVEVDVCGYSKANINVEVKDGFLEITGTPTVMSQTPNTIHTQSKIMKSEFKRVIALDSMYIKGSICASMSDGILTVVIEPSVESVTKVKIS